MFLSDSGLSLLGDLGQFLVVLGLVGAVSLFFFPRDRPLQERSLGVLFTLMAAGGVALAWRVDRLQNADRDLTPDQQVAVSEAVSRFPTVKFEVFTNRGSTEARSLALKIVDAVTSGTHAKPAFFEETGILPRGVVLVFAEKDADLRRAVLGTVGKRLMDARVVFVTDARPEVGENTVRIMVGEKP